MQNTYKEYMCELSLLCILTYSTTYIFKYRILSRVINKNKQQ